MRGDQDFLTLWKDADPVVPRVMEFCLSVVSAPRAIVPPASPITF